MPIALFTLLRTEDLFSLFFFFFVFFFRFFFRFFFMFFFMFFFFVVDKFKYMCFFVFGASLRWGYTKRATNALSTSRTLMGLLHTAIHPVL